MGRKHKSNISGLIKRNEVWHIEKMVNGERIRESTGTGDIEEAQKYLIHRLEQIRLAKIYGVRPKRIFREAAIKYLKENQHKRSIREDARWVKMLDSFIGDLNLECVHMGSLQSYIDTRRKQGVKNRTINYGLQVVRRILNMAADEWLDEYGLSWLHHAPKVKLLNEKLDKRKPYPLSWEEQEKLFSELPTHLRQMALFKLNTGCRDREVCQLRWEWEIPVPEMNTSVFVIPGKLVKNTDDRLVVLNEIAKEVVDLMRGIHPIYVFTYQNKPIDRMLNSAWKKARERAGLPQVRVHDLKHTFGRRLRSAGVSFEDRQDLLGHRSAKITTDYSAAEICNLLEAANLVCRKIVSTPVLTILKKSVEQLQSSEMEVVSTKRHIDVSMDYRKITTSDLQEGEGC